ncbi:MAG: hypothetical protein KGZ33_00900 [Alkaliphilus sp.]|nr:hypothetical protein [Alkaliphilus sp.]
MGFVNQKSVLIHDRKGNTYNFYWNDNQILLNNFDNAKQKFDNKILLDNASLEFDVVMDQKDNIFAVLQKENGQLLLMSYQDHEWSTNELANENSPEIFNLNILFCFNKLHIVYCVSSNESKALYRIYHHYLSENEWKTLEVGNIRTKNLLNPFQIIHTSNKIIIGFYNVVDNEEQIFIKEFNIDNNLWVNTIQLTSSSNDKLYIDILLTRHNILHLTYNEFFEGNLVVKYEKFKLADNRIAKVFETVLSNPSNCSHPLFVSFKDNLWISWTELDQIAGAFSEDEGLSWSNPYLWRESKSIDFFRHKFNTNDDNIKSHYQFNYAFGKGYPEYSLLGFGSTDKATEIFLNHKKKDEDLEIDANLPKSGKIFQTETSKQVESQEKINNQEDCISEELKELQERIDRIEEYLLRKRRGFIFPSRR